MSPTTFELRILNLNLTKMGSAMDRIMRFLGPIGVTRRRCFGCAFPRLNRGHEPTNLEFSRPQGKAISATPATLKVDWRSSAQEFESMSLFVVRRRVSEVDQGGGAPLPSGFYQREGILLLG